MNTSIEMDDYRKRIQTLTKLADMVRLIFTFKKVSTMFLKDLLVALNDN